jgi:hypothetical protein
MIPDTKISYPASSEFEIEIDTCCAVKGGESALYINEEILTVSINAGAGAYAQQNVFYDYKCGCDCPDKNKNPEPKYNLKLNCPDKNNQVPIFAWDCQTQYEAQNREEVDAHDRAMKTLIGRQTLEYYDSNPAWVDGCKKCLCNFYEPWTFNFRYSNTEGPCPGGHQCDRAVFNVSILTNDPRNNQKIQIGTFNLNNGSNGGDVTSSPITIDFDLLRLALIDFSQNPPKYNENGNIQISIDCALDDCHNGIAWLQITNGANKMVFDGCVGQGLVTVDICSNSF